MREICDRLLDQAPVRRPVRFGKVDILPYAPAQLRDVFSGMLANEKKLRVLFGTAAGRFQLEAGRICLVTAGGLEVVPRFVVDCSGDGVVIQSDPALYEPAPETGRQLAGYTIRLGGLAGADDTLPIKVPYVVRQGVTAGILPPYLKFTTFIPGDSADEGWCKLSLPAARPDPRAAQDDAKRLHDYLKEHLPIFRTSRIIESSPEVLEREGPRLKGLYTLTAEDVLEGRKFPDAVVRSAWPVEIWDPERGPTYRYLKAGEFCDIPLRCLKSAAAANLLCAGRCISATREALGATRVMGTCMALGEAAGREAAKSLSGNL